MYRGQGQRQSDFEHGIRSYITRTSGNGSLDFFLSEADRRLASYHLDSGHLLPAAQSYATQNPDGTYALYIPGYDGPVTTPESDS